MDRLLKLALVLVTGFIVGVAVALVRLLFPPKEVS